MRVRVLRVCFLLLFFLLTVNLFYVQVINGQYYLGLSEQNRIRLLPVPSLRGRILDAYGVPIADNRPSYEVSIIPEDFDRNQTRSVSTVLQLQPDELKAKLSSHETPPFAPTVVKQDASMQEVFQLEELQPEVDGLHIQVQGCRFYPFGEVTGHLTGYLGKISREEYRKGDRARFLFNDYVGRSGLELSMDELLRGYHGGTQVEVNAKGRPLRVLSERRPIRGQDVRLSIDAVLQEKFFELIKNDRAVLALMDIQTDGLLALVTHPGYDPNAFVTPVRSGERLQYLSSPEHVLVDSAIHVGFPLGSIFKLVVALGGLEEGVITPATVVNCQGSFSLKRGQRSFKCWRPGGHGPMDLNHAVEQSCNVFFYETGKRLGADRIAHYARELGLGSSWDLELGRVFPGLVPDSDWKKKELGEKWYQGETISFAIGQSYLLVSPLQVLRLVATIARDGEVAEPHVLERRAHNNGQAPKRHAKISKDHFELLKKAMYQVVQSSHGTGQLARVDGLAVAGKTATAQVPEGQDHSWFAGFAPFDHPEVAIVVLVEHGGSGGMKAAPIARQALEMWAERKLQLGDQADESFRTADSGHV